MDFPLVTSAESQQPLPAHTQNVEPVSPPVPNIAGSAQPPPRIRRRNRMITSCLECRRRKLKCDKSHPCTWVSSLLLSLIFLRLLWCFFLCVGMSVWGGTTSIFWGAIRQSLIFASLTLNWVLEKLVREQGDSFSHMRHFLQHSFWSHKLKIEDVL